MRLCVKSVLSLLILGNSLLAQTTSPAKPPQSANPSSSEKLLPDMKISMDKVRVLLDKAKEESTRGNEQEENKYLAELNTMARQAYDLQDITTCETIFRQILNIKDNFSDALLGLADLYRRTNPIWAVEYYSRYLKDNPSDSGAYYGRGSCYLARDAYSLAIQDLQNLIRLEPNHVPGLTNLALAYRGLAREKANNPDVFKQAVDYMRQAVQAAESGQDPESRKIIPDLKYRLGVLCFEYGQILQKAQPSESNFEDAIKSLNDAMNSAKDMADADPENVEAINQVLSCFDTLTEVYSALAKANPKDPFPFVRLAALTRQKIEIQNRSALVLMVGYYKKAVDVDPSAADIWGTLAQTYAQLRNFKGALNAVNKAVTLVPGNQEYKKMRDQFIAATQPATRPKAK